MKERAGKAKDFKEGFLAIREKVQAFAANLIQDVELTEKGYGEDIANIKLRVTELEDKLKTWTDVVRLSHYPSGVNRSETPH